MHEGPPVPNTSADPKSIRVATTPVPSGCMSTIKLSGLMSPWNNPWSCRAASACKHSAQIEYHGWGGDAPLAGSLLCIYITCMTVGQSKRRMKSRKKGQGSTVGP